MARAILLMGTARSGTSMTANIVSELGVRLPGDLIGPHQTFNPNGHFEEREWHELNRDFRDNGCVPNGDIAVRYRDIVRKHSGGIWAVKDPAFVWSLWYALCVIKNYGDDVRVVAIHRSFGSVVRSKMKHQKIGRQEAVEREVAERTSMMRQISKCDVPVWHVDYEELLAGRPSSAIAIRKLGEFMVEGLDTVSPEQLSRAVNVVDPALYHNRPGVVG